MTDQLRKKIRQFRLESEEQLVPSLIYAAKLETHECSDISRKAADLVRAVRADMRPTLPDRFLGEYGLSTREGVALMCLAEALLRVPDTETIDQLIADKIGGADWQSHAGHAPSALVNASTWALMLTGQILKPGKGAGLAETLRAMTRRLGEPVLRAAVSQAMRELGSQFVLGETIEKAVTRAEKSKNLQHSYDMLGEAAVTERDALRYVKAYHDAITHLGTRAGKELEGNPGISVKLSALHPRYQAGQKSVMFDTLLERVGGLARLAASHNLGFTIDAEEADRLDISLDVIETLLADTALADWDGFGMVVQAYGKRALPVIEWINTLAAKLDRRVTVRLVKGAYWDTEIKRAQVAGIEDYPVFTRKISSDISYIACARRLLELRDRIYPQFATHNAHSITAILHMAGGVEGFEFQRLHGMGEALHEVVQKQHGSRCRVYAPVGAHRDLLAYLVRRLLENGANSSFVNQLLDPAVAPETLAADPFESARDRTQHRNPALPAPTEIFAPRENSRGWDLEDDWKSYAAARAPFEKKQWDSAEDGAPVHSPFDGSHVGQVHLAGAEEIEQAFVQSRAHQPAWEALDQNQRAEVLNRAATLYEENSGEIFAILAREAGKTPLDCVAELREAVDFLRYYASGVEDQTRRPRGIFACISPWNFPLAIFTGQISAALACGNAVLAKPAPQTPLIARFAVDLLHRAGVPKEILHLLPGGADVGARVTSDPRVDGICFTGSTATARRIQASMADHLSPDAVLIAETGGINAMIVDSTALLEQATRDIIASAFQSAGQRCSALRVIFAQADIADDLEALIRGAMDVQVHGDPWDRATDIGPIIDRDALDGINAYLEDKSILHRVASDHPQTCPATLVSLPDLTLQDREVFGPVLHISRFAADQLDDVIGLINASGYGLTFGLHTRLDDRIADLTTRVTAGNHYVNRNQIGAIVGSQPFGGEGLSGTGPKAGGPLYLRQFTRGAFASDTEEEKLSAEVSAAELEAAFAKAQKLSIDHAALEGLARNGIETALLPQDLPGPTGELNAYRALPRGMVLCLGPDVASAEAQITQALVAGCKVIAPTPLMKHLSAELQSLALAEIRTWPAPAALEQVEALGLVCFAAKSELARQYRKALARRAGPIVTFSTDQTAFQDYLTEHHVCIDTTASGGNASLLAQLS